MATPKVLVPSLYDFSASETLLNSTSAIDVISFTPPIQANFMIGIYYRVVTGQTNLTINVTWTDSTGAQTQNIIPSATPIPTGSYTIIPVFINATAAVIKVTCTAGTSNQIYISAACIGL